MAAVAQDSNALAVTGRLLPSLSARGTYTHNQFEVDFPLSMTQVLTIQPLDQLDGAVQLDVPVLDLASIDRSRAARADARAAKLTVRATLLDVERQVARIYYQLIGAEALRRSTEKNLAAAQDSLDLSRERRAGGIATQLEVERAAAEVERAKQNIADAELLSRLSRRSLRTLTGIEPAGDVPSPEDDLHEEAPLEVWEKTPDEQVPLLAASAELVRSAAANARAAKLSLVPTLSATGLERFTNATAFLFGHNAIFSAALGLSWRLDVPTLANMRTTSANAAIAGIRHERVRLVVRDQIHEAWQRVRANIAKSRAARAEVFAADLAAQFAGERYASGAGTQLDLVQAQRDAFAATVARIQSDADLVFARALLRLTSGVPLEKDEPR
jgi:outer membrane protein TolC